MRPVACPPSAAQKRGGHGAKSAPLPTLRGSVRGSASAMLTFLARRLVQLIPTLFFVSILIFSLQQLLPGDPALVMAGEERDPAVIAQIRQQYRLHQPGPGQYVFWGKGVVLGGFGEALRHKGAGREVIW